MANEKRLIEYHPAAYQIEKLQRDAFRNLDKASCKAYQLAGDILSESPTVDAVEVVRCKDCDNTCPGTDGMVCTVWGTITDPDGWCYKGERREGE